MSLETTRFDASVYLPRVDSLVLSPDRSFNILSIVPAIRPTAPDVNDEVMEIYQIDVPAYTDSTADVQHDTSTTRDSP